MKDKGTAGEIQATICKKFMTNHPISANMLC